MTRSSREGALLRAELNRIWPTPSRPFRNEARIDLLVVKDVLDDFGFPFHPAAIAKLFQTEKTFAIDLGADEQDITDIENLTRTPKRPPLSRQFFELIQSSIDSV